MDAGESLLEHRSQSILKNSIIKAPSSDLENNYQGPDSTRPYFTDQEQG